MDFVSSSKNIMLVTASIGLTLCGYYVFIGEPMHSRTGLVKAELQQIQQKIQHLRTQEIKRDEMEARIHELENRVNKEGPSLQQVSHEVRTRHRVARMARKHRVEITEWQPEPPLKGSIEGVRKVPIRVQVEGGYHQVAKLLNGILHLPEVYSIPQFTLVVTDNQPAKSLLRTNFVITKFDLSPPKTVPKNINRLQKDVSFQADS